MRNVTDYRNDYVHLEWIKNQTAHLKKSTNKNNYTVNTNIIYWHILFIYIIYEYYYFFVFLFHFWHDFFNSVIHSFNRPQLYCNLLINSSI